MSRTGWQLIDGFTHIVNRKRRFVPGHIHIDSENEICIIIQFVYWNYIMPIRPNLSSIVGLVKLVSTASLCSICHTKPLLLPNSLNTASNWLPGEWRAAHADEFRDKTRHTYHISIELMPKKSRKSKAYWQICHWGIHWDNRTLTIKNINKEKKRNRMSASRRCVPKFWADDVKMLSQIFWTTNLILVCVCAGVRALCGCAGVRALCVFLCCSHYPQPNWTWVQDIYHRSPGPILIWAWGLTSLGPRDTIAYGTKCVSAVTPKCKRLEQNDNSSVDSWLGHVHAQQGVQWGAFHLVVG